MQKPQHEFIPVEIIQRILRYKIPSDKFETELDQPDQKSVVVSGFTVQTRKEDSG